MTKQTNSLWWDLLPKPLISRAPIDSNKEVDVAIIGAGYTGLWCAYYLLQKSPNLKIAIVESSFVGFGASGRNGGWCSALFPVGLEKIANNSNKETAVRMQKLMFETVDEVKKVADTESIDIEWQKGGSYSIARNQIQLKRAMSEYQHFKDWGFGEADFQFFNQAETKSRINATQVLGSFYTPHCAAINPAKLVQGLGQVVEKMGATIYENSKVTSFSPNKIEVNNRHINAKYIINATEGYRSNLPGYKRSSAPIYSLMIATEPLSEQSWSDIGIKNRETFADYRNVLIYGQRTKDNRFAFGGRGAPYHFNSSIKDKYDMHEPTHKELLRTLIELFPVIKDVKVTHSWGGPLAITRDWAPHVSLDLKTGLASAGGYVGDGVGTSNLAGRTLADLILNEKSELVTVPWVNHKSRKWDVEPFRYIGINGTLKLAWIADFVEERFGFKTLITNLLNKLKGN